MAAIISNLLLDFSKVNKKKILDAGCGPGALLPVLQKHGEVIGLDKSADALKFAQKYAKVRRGDITKLTFKPNLFDVVVCADVLYHTWVDDETKALAEFYRVLKPGGLLIVREPAYNWMRGNEDRGSMTKRRFSKNRLVTLLLGGGFKIRKVSYINFFLFPLVLTRRVITTLGYKQGSSDMQLPPNYINKLLAAFLRVEGKLLKYINLPFGSSLICVAQK